MISRKRSRDDYDRLIKKIRKLEKKVKKRYISDTEESDHSDSPEDIQNSDNIPFDTFSDEIPSAKEHSQTHSPEVPPPQFSAENLAEPDNPEHTGDTLDEEILDILGEDPDSQKIFGENLHKDVAPRWKHILQNGLPKEIRSDLLKAYLPAENCPTMKAPKLNPEMKAALSDVNNKKDAYSQAKQSQLSSCLSALGKALNIIVTKPSSISQELLKPVSAAARLLCDYHHKESLSRRYAIINPLNKDIKVVAKDTVIDEFLFGSDLAEKLKNSKAVLKSGMELRPPTAGPSQSFRNKPSSSTAPTTQPAYRRNATLNARGAPRTSAAEPRVNPVPRRQAASQRHPYNSSAKPSPQRYRSKRL